MRRYGGSGECERGCWREQAGERLIATDTQRGREGCRPLPWTCTLGMPPPAAREAPRAAPPAPHRPRRASPLPPPAPAICDAGPRRCPSARTHKCMHTHSQKQSCRRARARARAFTHRNTHTNTNTHKHTQTQLNASAPPPPHTRTARHSAMAPACEEPRRFSTTHDNSALKLEIRHPSRPLKSR